MPNIVNASNGVIAEDDLQENVFNQTQAVKVDGSLAVPLSTSTKRISLRAIVPAIPAPDQSASLYQDDTLSSGVLITSVGAQSNFASAVDLVNINSEYAYPSWRYEYIDDENYTILRYSAELPQAEEGIKIGEYVPYTPHEAGSVQFQTLLNSLDTHGYTGLTLGSSEIEVPVGLDGSDLVMSRYLQFGGVDDALNRILPYWASETSQGITAPLGIQTLVSNGYINMSACHYYGLQSDE